MGTVRLKCHHEEILKRIPLDRPFSAAELGEGIPGGVFHALHNRGYLKKLGTSKSCPASLWEATDRLRDHRRGRYSYEMFYTALPDREEQALFAVDISRKTGLPTWAIYRAANVGVKKGQIRVGRRLRGKTRYNIYWRPSGEHGKN
jgi:hypothetical protein